MSEQDAFERILASLYDAMLDDRHWPVTSALIDEATGVPDLAIPHAIPSQPVKLEGLAETLGISTWD